MPRSPPGLILARTKGYIVRAPSVKKAYRIIGIGMSHARSSRPSDAAGEIGWERRSRR
jgi:hypothetical protein